MWTLAALETGVDQKADLVRYEELPGETGRIRISHPVYENGKRK